MEINKQALPLDEWHEDYGDVLWWKFPIVEPPYCGTPLDSDWPDYHTHWTRFDVPGGSPSTQQDDCRDLKKLVINAGLICFKCEGSKKLVRYGREELGEPNLVYSDCNCEGTFDSPSTQEGADDYMNGLRRQHSEVLALLAESVRERDIAVKALEEIRTYWDTRSAADDMRSLAGEAIEQIRRNTDEATS